ncbi:hypothetical protein CBA19CS11_30370 [Caballeronia novacaledonica]|uniref:DUF6484 domain-containing protein n=1 Tax=Caballeronia novacaledonica TaxID=1544861 RepID=UPI001EE35A34|nr:DUF6484 domain-containing protein [Caballeronia novacaledonica]GJH13234.1 hypothetical protein CBA19CS11_30370 [Caballeronia novacaledonica]
MNDSCHAVEAAAGPGDNAPLDEVVDADRTGTVALLKSLIDAPRAESAFAGLLFAELLALVDDGRVPVVSIGTSDAPAGIRAASLVDLHAAHVGRRVALMFENSDPRKPVVVGLSQGGAAWPLRDRPAQVQVDADGQRMVVCAEHQLELRCGKARITLKRDGAVEIVGETIVSQATAANRVRGGSVQLN